MFRTAFLPLLVASAALATQDVAGTWHGRLDVPPSPLALRVELTPGADGWTGALWIPARGLEALPLQALDVDPATGRVSFRLAPEDGAPSFSGALEDGALRGTFHQGTLELPLDLTREPPPESPARPQTPQGPFPYDAEEVRYAHDGIDLAGTLTLPRGTARVPAVLLITGSGAQDRDETIFDHKPFAVWADHLTRAGFAVLRVDDRGVGGSSGSVFEATAADFAQDALAGVAFLRGHPRIDPERVGVLGHSEGGIVGPLAATQSEHVAFVVMLAGTGVPGDALLSAQFEAGALAAGLAPEVVRDQVEAHERVVRHLLQGQRPEALRAARDLIALQFRAIGQPPAPEAELERLSTGFLARLESPWFQAFLRHDPREALRQLTVPVLVLNGELDLQVLPEQNLPEIEAALRAAGNERVTVVRFPGLNHLFQTARTGSTAEYAVIEETVAPVVLERVSAWLREVCAPE